MTREELTQYIAAVGTSYRVPFFVERSHLAARAGWSKTSFPKPCAHRRG